MNGKRTYGLPQAPRPKTSYSIPLFVHNVMRDMYEYYYQSYLLYYTKNQHVVKCFLYIFKKNNFFLDKTVYDGIIVIKAPEPGLYITLGYIQYTTQYSQVIAKVLLVTADCTSLYKVIIRKSLGARYTYVCRYPSVPCLPLYPRNQPFLDCIIQQRIYSPKTTQMQPSY